MSIDLSIWELQLPIAKPNSRSIEIISPKELIAGYRSPYFHEERDGVLTFTCPLNGVKTKNAKYPRSELRERKFDGEWKLVGNHSMEAECEVEKLAGGKGMIIGQIHGTDSKGSPQFVKLRYDTSGKIILELKDDKDIKKNKKHTVYKADILEKIKYRIEVNDHKLTVVVNGKSYEQEFKNHYWDTQEYYFKAGCYLQNNSKRSSDTGIIKFYSLKISHNETINYEGERR